MKAIYSFKTSADFQRIEVLCVKRELISAVEVSGINMKESALYKDLHVQTKLSPQHRTAMIHNCRKNCVKEKEKKVKVSL
jgi:hypothetical protein